MVHYINTHGCYNYSNNKNQQSGRGGFSGRPYPCGSQNTRGQQRNTKVNTKKQCYKCGNHYGQNHLQSCPAKDMICSKCTKRGHFSKICQSTNFNYLEDRHEEQQEKVETERLETERDPVAFAEFNSNNGWDDYQKDKFSGMAIAESFETKNTKKCPKMS